jgi:DNA-binding MarR family transcriptional regulator
MAARMAAPLEEDILRALRRITRGIDLHSRRLRNTYGLTAPQLVCLRAIRDAGEVGPTVLARKISLSQATVTGIIDRLLHRQLVTRERKAKDRRLVTVALTEAGRSLVEQAPSPLQETFLQELSDLSVPEREGIRDTLNRIVSMMGGDDLEAAAVLSSSPAAQSRAEVKDVLHAGETDLTLIAELASDRDVDVDDSVD